MKNIEEQLKKHFQEREIQPSNNAWDRLEILLNKYEQEKEIVKPKMTIWNTRYEIVAVFVFALGLLSIVFQNNSQSVPSFQTIEKDEVSTDQWTVEETNQSYEKTKDATSSSSVQKHTSNVPSHKTQEKKVVYREVQLANVTVENEIEFKESPLKINKETIAIKEVSEKVELAEQQTIYVNPKQLLIKAEMEKNIENSLSDKQYVIKKLKEINTVVTK